MGGSDWTRRDFFKRSAIFGALAIGGSAILDSCTSAASGGDVLSAARRNGYISVGIAGEQPFGYTDQSGTVTGEAPEVARAVFRNLGVNDIHATQVDFNQLIPGLNARQFDMVCAGMDITPKRCESVNFSIPDYSALVAFLVPKGNPQQVHDFNDIKSKGLILAVESGAVEANYAIESGIPASQIRPFETPDELLRAVTGNRAYSAVLTDISLKTLVKQNPMAAVEVTPGFAPIIGGQPGVETGGFVFRKDEGDLINQFNGQLKNLHDSGQWLSIVTPFGFTKDNIPAPGLTTQKLCAAG